MKKFAGIYIFNGQVRHMTVEATDEQEARSLGANPQPFGVQGEAMPCGSPAATASPVFDLREVTNLFKVSRGTVHRWLIEGRLERIPDIRKILITRESVERQAKAS